jgi:hypothetical protein
MQYLMADICKELARQGLARDGSGNPIMGDDGFPLGVRGMYWDSMQMDPLNGDFCALAISTAISEGVIQVDGDGNPVDFPWPITDASSAEDRSLRDWLLPASGNSSLLLGLLSLRSDALGWTDGSPLKTNLYRYMDWLRSKNDGFMRFLAQQMHEYGHDDFAIIPAGFHSPMSTPLFMNQDDASYYAHTYKSELGVEGFVDRRQPVNSTSKSVLPDMWLAQVADMLIQRGRDGKPAVMWNPLSAWTPNEIGGNLLACSARIDQIYLNSTGISTEISSKGIVRDSAIKGFLENKLLATWCCGNVFDAWYFTGTTFGGELAESLDGFNNKEGTSPADNSAPFIRRLAGMVASLKDGGLNVSQRSRIPWCAIVHSPELAAGSSIWNGSTNQTWQNYYWYLLGALHACCLL